jgi:hypothetical protein
MALSALPPPAIPEPSRETKRLLSSFARFLARVDGDAIDRDDRVPPRVVAGMKKLGAFRLRVPLTHGGLGLSHSDHHRVAALVAARSMGLTMWITTQSLTVELLAKAGTAQQRAELLPRLAAGELSALAMTEAEAGADPSRTAVTARPARGGYRLDGRKLWVTNGPVARWIVVLARAPGGLSLFVVDARSPGFEVERRCRFLGLRGMENGVLRLRGVFVPAYRRLGDEGDGLRLGLTAMNVGRLAENASVAERLERLETLVSRLSGVSARTAAWADAGRGLRWESMLAKLFAASAAWEAADLALQLRGGRGYETVDSQRARGEAPEPVERLLRDARGLRLIEGTDDVLRAALARRIRELEGRGGEPPAAAYARADEAARLFGDICGLGGRP